MKENNEIRSSAHSKYRCQYHIVFAPKFRRKEIYGKLRRNLSRGFSANKNKFTKKSKPKVRFGALSVFLIFTHIEIGF